MRLRDDASLFRQTAKYNRPQNKQAQIVSENENRFLKINMLAKTDTAYYYSGSGFACQRTNISLMEVFASLELTRRGYGIEARYS
jgi:hypothetical protein